MEEVIKKINKCKELSELFEIWKNYQKNDEKNTGIFVSDGYINKTKYESSEKKILFILKESHSFNGTALIKGKEQNIIEQPKIGFYKTFLEEKIIQNDNGKEIEKIVYVKEKNRIIPKDWANPESKGNKRFKLFDNRPKQKEKIARMSEYILHKKITSNYEELKKSLEQVAFMNINKMGGGDNTNPKEMSDYYDLNKDFIKKEISILKPQVIVLMINNSYIEEDLERSFKNIEFVDRMLHTSARGKNLNLNEEEIEFLNKNITCKYNIDDINKLLNNNYKTDEDNVFNLSNDKNSAYLRFDKATLKYLLKFIYKYETK